MRALSAAALLKLRDAGTGRDAVERALLVLAEAWPDDGADALARLPIGRRDARLFLVREATFGAALPCVVGCPACQEKLELEPMVADLRLEPPDAPSPLSVEFEGRPIVFRLPDSLDVAWAAAAPRDARARLLARCVPDAALLGADALAAVSAEMARLDPQADVSFDLTCPACGHRWIAPFDIAIYLWREIEEEAARLLGEVDALARTYGWSESEVLGLSRPRRRAYLQLVEARWA